MTDSLPRAGEPVRMAGPRRFNIPAIPQHVVQRGNSRQLCFLEEADYLEYLRRLTAAAKKHAVAVHAYVLMTNHVHLLATPQSAQGVGKLMQSLGAGFVRSFNARHGRSGTLWDGRYYSALVGSDGYFWNCHRYIELNPVRGGLVERPGEYRWSSYARNAHGKSDAVVTPHDSYFSLAPPGGNVQARYREMFADGLAQADVDEIREKLVHERAFGSEEFIAMIESASTRSPHHRRRGRPWPTHPALEDA